MDNSTFISLPTAQLVAITAYGEAANQGADGLMAVVNVIGNRVANGGSRYVDSAIYSQTGDLYKAVILKPSQFSMYNSNDPQRQLALDIAQNFNYYVSTYPALNTAYQFAQMLLNGQLTDNVSGATMYRNPDNATARWNMSELTYIGDIGAHQFFRHKNEFEVVREAFGEAVRTAEENPIATAFVLAAIGFGVWRYYKKGRS